MQKIQIFKIFESALNLGSVSMPLSLGLSTGCPKSLGHLLKPHISKTTMHDGKFETYLERTNSGNYFDTKRDPICDTFVYSYKLNDILAT